MVIKDDEFSQQRGWIKGRNERTGKTGAIPIDAIFILPTLSKPSKELMVQRMYYYLGHFRIGGHLGFKILEKI